MKKNLSLLLGLCAAGFLCGFAGHRLMSGQASQFAVNWAKNDPTAASDWVQSLPAGNAKLWAQKNLAANWSQVDPEATDRWLSTLPAADRTQVREFMSKGK